MSDQNENPAACAARVGKGVITFACYLPRDHRGPHAALENQPSMIERHRWEQEQAEGDAARRILAESQGPALTSAQGLHETPPLPHPELRQPRLDPDGRLKDPPPAVYPDPATHSVEVEVEIDNRCPACDAETSEFDDMVVTNGEGQHISCRRCPACLQFFAPATTIKPVAKEPTKQRPGDQPLPQVNDFPAIQGLVIEDIQARIAVGIERYGTPLQPFNGRDAVLDAYEEALDLAVYLRQVRYEHSVMAANLRSMARNLEQHGLMEQAQALREWADILEPPSGG